MTYPKSLRFRAGQFISVRIGDEYHIRRSYSIASPTGVVNQFEFLVGVGSGSTANWALSLKEGATLHFNGPMGFFCCDDIHEGDIVFAATGVGIAPMLPMIEEILRRDSGPSVRLFWGVRTDGIKFVEEKLKGWAECFGRFRFELWVTQPRAPDLGYQTGRITQSVVDTATLLRCPTYYLCGNGAMIGEVLEGLASRGVGREAVRAESFFLPPPRI